MTELESKSSQCYQLLSRWRERLIFSNREHTLLKGHLINLNRNIKQLGEKRLRISVYGRVGVGKSSLLNALAEEQIFITDVAHGCTRHIKTIEWKANVNQLHAVELSDTPGIDEISPAGRDRLATRIALHSDLILLVLDNDINNVEIDALKSLLASGKPIIIVLNRCDQWTLEEQNTVIRSIQNRLPKEAKQIHIEAVSAAPREVHLLANGKARSHRCPSKVDGLRKHLLRLLNEQGELLLELNALRQADLFQKALKHLRLKQHKAAAQGLIGRFAVIKASGVAVNPIIILDLAAGIVCDTALVIQLCNVYGIEMGGPGARHIFTKLSVYGLLLGSVQLVIQLALGSLRQILLIGAPFTGGLTLAPAAPVAIFQAAIAVQTTQLIGRITAIQLMKGSNRQMAVPKTMLKHLLASNPAAKHWLGYWSNTSINKQHDLKTLLP